MVKMKIGKNNKTNQPTEYDMKQWTKITNDCINQLNNGASDGNIVYTFTCTQTHPS